jgi:hypothetical protein
MVTVDPFGSVNRVPAGRFKAGPPANELVTLIVRGVLSLSKKNDERSYLPVEFNDRIQFVSVDLNVGEIFGTVT